MTWSIPVALLAAGVWAWPSDVPRRRLRALRACAPRRFRWRRPPEVLLITGGAALLGGFFLGVAGVLAGALVASTAWRYRQDGRRRQEASAAIEGIAEALRSLVAELSAGAHPVEAAEAAAADAGPVAGRALRAAAAAVRLGGDVDTALAGGARAAPLAPDVVRATVQLGRAWHLAAHHGLPLAHVLDAVREDLEQRVRFARRVLAHMSGPRASAAVLAFLPVAGVCLGESIGADPLQVLAGSVAGQVLVAVGAALTCAGIAWSARITRTAVFR